jgi:hypothetical protein
MALSAQNSFVSVAGSANVSNASLFSPLREQSFNSPVSTDGFSGGKGGGLGLPKTPVGSFNRSNVNTPLISPLTMIREEDLEVREDEEDETIATRLSKENFVTSLPSTTMTSTRPSIVLEDVESFSTNSKSSSSQLPSIREPSPVMVEALPAVRSFKPNAVSSSTPAHAAPLVPTVSEYERNHLMQLANADSRESISQIKALMTAFPAAVIESAAMRKAATADPDVLDAGNQEAAAAFRVPSAAATTTTTTTITSFQQEYLKNCVEESMDDFCSDMRKQMWHLHYDMVRSFQLQQEGMGEMLKMYAVNDDLASEVERLRKENEELRKYF